MPMDFGLELPKTHARKGDFGVLN